MDAAGTGHPAGSVETMAPEVGLGLRTTVRSDVYSLGSSLYQLLTGDWLNPALKSLPTAKDKYHAVAHHTPSPSETSHPTSRSRCAAVP
jgi:serine/threonine protein kinase